MKYFALSSSPLLLWCLLLCIMPGFAVSQNGSQPEYENCRNEVFKCGNIYAGYPFFGGFRLPRCGHPGLELRCDHDTNITSIGILGVKYEVMNINHDRHTLRIGREDFIENSVCRPQLPILYSIIDPELFDLTTPDYINATLFYDCPSSSISSSLVHSPCPNDTTYYYHNISLFRDNMDGDGCLDNLTFPILRISWERFRKHPSLQLAREETYKGFEVKWKEEAWEEACRKCNASGGACGFGFSNKMVCICPHPSQNWPPGYPKECRHPGSKSWSKQKLVHIGMAVAAIVLVSSICFVVLRLKGKSLSSHLCQGKMNDNVRIEAFIKKFGSLAPRRYFYAEIKKMTKKFNEKLGQGGYGCVYKGKLPDGRLVAVKVLSESKGNGEDFMNEVASISRTSHVNIVTLLGFCFERSKRALVYEFMPHGSLDRFIYDQRSHHKSHRLEWKTLYDIALGIARGLEYLHQGCNTRILHFDIKPHNILLDENFRPKISDFGLSKLCERSESIISMACARGTIGYIAPEVFCRNFGGVSYKSDVYSYGMMVLEIVGGRKNFDVGVSQTSEVYFPSWIYKHLDQSMNLNFNGVTAEEEEEIARKLIIVSLWCIQNDPSDRPSMTKVLEMLHGSLQSLVIPPRPFVSSPVASSSPTI